MYIRANIKHFKVAPGRFNFRKVWDFEPEELSKLADTTLKELSKESFAPQYLSTSWSLQAIAEFQDLQDMPIPPSGPWPNNSNYLFFEGLNCLRESTLAGLSGTFHASLALLRSALETEVFYVWWRRELQDHNNWAKFQAWLDNSWNPPPVKNLLLFVTSELRWPASAPSQDKVLRAYESLCAYSHKPLLDESLTRIRGTNFPAPSNDLLHFWLDAVGTVASIILHLLMATRPESLFPVTPYRKFGFNPPAGVFFDKSNGIPIEQTLGKQIDEYRKFYETETKELLEWFNGFPDLEDDAILETWPKDRPSDEGPDLGTAERIEHRWCLLKAEMRALHWAFAYRDYRNPPTLLT